MFHVKHRGALLAAALCLAACGFRPLYGERSYGPDVQAQMSAVDIAPIEDRLGQIVRNHLLDAMNPRGAPGSPRYRLEVILAPTRENLAFREDEAATRVNLRVSATYVLKRARSDDVLERGGVRVITSYNVTREEYATLVADRDAQARAAREIADEIVSRLAVWFERPTQA
jgi:LPS-assembly lipoprotein